MDIRQQFLEASRHSASNASNLPWRLMPGSFDPLEEPMPIVEQPLEWPWRSLERHLQEHRLHALMVRLPLFWQLEIPIFRACREAGAYLLINDQDNMPLGAAALREASTDCVLTERDDALRFAMYLKEKQAPLPRSWFIIHRPDASEWGLPEHIRHSGAAITAEVHLFPGVSVLEQCAELAKKQTPQFHVAESWIPLKARDLPWALRATGSCECGKDILQRE